MSKNFTILFFVFTFLAQLINGQGYNFEKVSAKNGLPSNTVYGIDIDPDGYLWVATVLGLYRYDGYNFVKATEGSGGNKPIDVSSKSLLYGQNDNAFFKLNTQTKKYQKLINLVTSDADPNNDQYNSIYVDSDNDVWSNDYNYVKRYLPSQNKLELYKILPNKGEYNFSKFVDDQKGSVYIGTVNGLYQFIKKTKTLKLLKANLYIKSIQIAKNSLMLGVNDGKLIEYNIDSKLTNEIGDLGYANDILYISEAWDQKYWVATANRLFLYNRITQKSEEMKNLSKESLTFTGIVKDAKNKIFWFSTQAGLLKLNYNELGINNINLPENMVDFPVKVNCFLEEKNDQFWLGLSHSGLLLFDKVKNSFLKIGCHDKISINKIVKNINGEIYCATNLGVYKKVGNHLKKVIATQKNVNSIIIDHKNRLWVLPNFAKIMVYQLPQLKPLKPWNSVPNDLFFEGNRFNDVFENVDKRIWFAAWFPKGFGICYFDEIQKKFILISEINEKRLFVADYFISISKVANTTDLIFSAYGGSNKIDKNGKIIGEIRTYEKKEVAYLPHFDKIVQDSENNQWLASSEGLYMINRKTQKISRFTEFDGLTSNNLTSGFLLNKNENLLIGQNNGFAILYTKKFLQKRTNHQLKLSNIKILGNTKIVNIQEDLIFEREQNSLSFDFSTLSFNNASQIFYKYRINKNSSWIDNGNSNNITFANLPFGEYNLEVKVGDNIGNWLKKPLIIPFEIKSVFYETAWFKTFLVLLFLSTVYAFYRYRIAQITQMHKIRSRISSDIHDEIGSTMSGISIIGTMLKDKFGTDSKSKLLAERLVQDANQVSNTLDDIVWSVKPQNDKLLDLSSRMNRFASELFEAKAIDYKIKMPIANLDATLKMDLRHDLYLIFKEAVNNLIKHSNCKKAEIDFILDKRHLYLTINDDGIGFDLTAFNSRNGIKNMQERAKKLGGTFQIRSIIGEGTKIQVKLPV